MKSGNFVPLDLSDFARPRKFSFNGVEYMGRVSPANLPEGFFVETDDEARRVYIRYHYFAAPDEPRVVQVVNNTKVELGRHSQRVFSLEVSNVDPGKVLPVADAARIFRDVLLAVFGALEQADPPPGVRFGYEAACAGIAPANEPPPPWMIEALKTLRSERQSIH